MIAAERLTQIQEYYFSRKLEEVRAMQADGHDIINLGIGSPDLAPPPAVLAALNSAIGEAGAHQYQPYKGQPKFRRAIQEFYAHHYSVVLQESEVLPLMGSKEGILHISMAFLNAGDQVLIPNPGYPTYESVTRMLGAEVVPYELTEAGDWLPDLEELSQRDLSRVKLMWVNYPHMPTGAQATEEIFSELVAFAQEHDILLVNDNPYSFILNEKRLSVLAVEGAKDVALELNSLSKTFNMSGWRVGMLCGSETHLQAVLKVKSNMDSGMFYPLQAGATAALRLPESWFREQDLTYSLRREKITALAKQLGCTPGQGESGMFVWCRVPGGYTSEGFVDVLLHNHHIFAAPGFVFGSQGEGFVRFSLCAKEELMEKALKRISA